MSCEIGSYWIPDCPDNDWFCDKIDWVDGGICKPYCPPPEKWDPVTEECVCADGGVPNLVGACCPGDYTIIVPTDPPSDHGFCDCPHDNEERKCLSRLPDDEQALCKDDCYCVEPYKSWLFDYGFTNSRNSWDECCGLEAKYGDNNGDCYCPEPMTRTWTTCTNGKCITHCGCPEGY